MGTLRVDHAVVSGTFSLDGETFDVDNNIWVVGDDAEHRRRVEARFAARDHDGIPDWVRVLERQAEYEPYLGPRLVVDTHLAKDPIAPIVDYLS